MMFTSLNADCDSSSRCSTASPADNLTYYQSPAGVYSDMSSPLSQTQDFTDLAVTSTSFVPTVTAISSCPDLQWMVQPLVSSVAPSGGRTHPYSASPDTFMRSKLVKGHGKGKTTTKRGRSEHVCPEEEEKKRVRRERNKMAAAKCRNRRRELTDTLQTETDELEDEKAALQSDIANLLKEKERLEFILAAHRPICKIPSDMEVSYSEVSPSQQGIVLEAVPELHSSTTMTSGASRVTEATLVTTSSASLFSSTPALASASTTVKMTDLEPSLEESLELLSKAELETVRSVPEVDLSNSLYTQDWEPLYTSAQGDLEPLCTPVVTCTPACTTYTSSFVFTYPESEVFPACGLTLRRGSSSNDQSSDSLSSPTLLTL